MDPENRLVARSLERQWEAQLREVERLEAEFARQQSQSPLTLNADQRQQLKNLVQDLPQVWRAETTSCAERKDLLHLLVADVTLTRRETDILVQIRWHTNELDTYEVPLPRRGAPPMSEAVIEHVRSLSRTQTDAQIAEEMNRAGTQTSRGEPFTARRVQGLRRRYGIRKRPPNPDRQCVFKGAL